MCIGPLLRIDVNFNCWLIRILKNFGFLMTSKNSDMQLIQILKCLNFLKKDYYSLIWILNILN